MSSSRNNTKLIKAIGEVDYLSVRALLKQGCDPSCKNKDGASALLMAVDQSVVNIAQVLVAHGANLEEGDSKGLTPLALAALRGDLEITNLLLNKGANSNAHGNEPYSMPLINAAASGKRDVAALLLKFGAEVNAQDHRGWNPLIHAITAGRAFVVKILLVNGADLDGELNSIHGNMSPLHWAVQENYLEIVEMLMEHGANAEIENSSGITPLSSASAEGNLKMVELFLTKGVDVNGTNLSHIPLINSIVWDRFDVFELLIANGADVNILDEDGKTPLDFAIKHKRFEMRDILMARGATRGKARTKKS